MKHPLVNVVIWILILTFVTHTVWARPGDPNAGGDDGGLLNTDDPTVLVLSISAGVLLVGGLIWWYMDKKQSEELEAVRQEAVTIGERHDIGLFPYQTQNQAAEEQQLDQQLTQFMFEALRDSDKFIVNETSSLTEKAIMVLGEVSVFGSIIEVETRMVDSQFGKTLFKETQSFETVDDIPAAFSEIVLRMAEALESE
ncbi:MAG: hypothetical protein D6675_09035 [Gemmatimonadetes bacterium]|nr:MAG: hypothetical protein D6675_09035 [Gemmatimonadota bacterium]